MNPRSRAKTVDGLPKFPIDLARVEDWLGESDEAAAILESALLVNPNDLDAISAMVQILVNSGREKPAMTWVQQLIKLAPWKAEAYDLAALVASRTGEPEAATVFKAEGDRVFALESEFLRL